MVRLEWGMARSKVGASGTAISSGMNNRASVMLSSAPITIRQLYPLMGNTDMKMKVSIGVSLRIFAQFCRARHQQAALVLDLVSPNWVWLVKDVPSAATHKPKMGLAEWPR